MYDFIMKSKIIKLQRIAFGILEGCASFRFYSNELLNKIKTKYPMLKNNSEQ